jgi:hypothetical protein
MLGVTEQIHLPGELHAVRSKFLELSGYADRDILAVNWKTNTFLTRNKGLYRMIGESILHLDGPSPDPEDRL